MTDIITPELIEVGARAMHEEVRSIIRPLLNIEPATWEEISDREREVVIRQTRACLSAALPEVIARAKATGALEAIAILQRVHAKNWDQEDFRESAVAAMTGLAMPILSPHPVNQEKE